MEKEWQAFQHLLEAFHEGVPEERDQKDTEDLDEGVGGQKILKEILPEMIPGRELREVSAPPRNLST